LFHNGQRVGDVVRATHAPSGSFTVRKLEPNWAGTYRFRTHAVRLNGANSCTGRARF
jgi:hypothetical protein